jgi:hypothetical protein
MMKTRKGKRPYRAQTLLEKERLDKGKGKTKKAALGSLLLGKKPKEKHTPVMSPEQASMPKSQKYISEFLADPKKTGRIDTPTTPMKDLIAGRRLPWHAFKQRDVQ